MTKWTVLKIEMCTISVNLGLLTAFFQMNASSVNNPSALDNEEAAKSWLARRWVEPTVTHWVYMSVVLKLTCGHFQLWPKSCVKASVKEVFVVSLSLPSSSLNLLARHVRLFKRLANQVGYCYRCVYCTGTEIIGLRSPVSCEIGDCLFWGPWVPNFI